MPMPTAFMNLLDSVVNKLYEYTNFQAALKKYGVKKNIWLIIKQASAWLLSGQCKRSARVPDTHPYVGLGQNGMVASSRRGAYPDLGFFQV